MRAVEGKNIKRTNFHCRVIKVLLPFWLLVSPPYYSPIFHSCRDFLLLLLPLLFTQAEKQLNICRVSLTSPPHPKATAASTVQPCKCRPRIHTSSSKAGPTPEVIAVSPAAIRGPRMHWPPLGFSSPHSCLSISVKVREQRASLMINTPQPHPTQAPAALIHDLYNSFLWLRLSRFSLLKYPSLNNKIQLFFKKKKKSSSLTGKVFPKYFLPIQSYDKRELPRNEFFCFLLKLQLTVDLTIFSLNTLPKYKLLQEDSDLT